MSLTRRRARDEPRDWLVIDRCVVLLRKCVHRFFPSARTLHSILDFVNWARNEAESESPSSTGNLRYLSFVLQSLQVKSGESFKKYRAIHAQ